MEATTSPHPSRTRIAVAAAIIVLAGLAAYHNSFDGGFIFDDGPAIRDNPTIRSLWPPSTPLSPPADTGGGGRPLANLTFALNYAFGGPAVWGYHALNLLLHLCSALLLFGLIRRTLARATDGAMADLRPLWIAAVAAVLWVVHPLTTASVAYLSQRTELLMAFFYLATLYSFRRGWLRTSIAACALGMMSKEVMVTAPLMVLLYDRTYVAGDFREAWRQRWRYYLALAGTWIVLGYLLTTGLERRSVGFGLGVSPIEYAFTQAAAILLYLKLALWPWPQVFDYGPVYLPGRAAAVVVVAAVAMVLAALRRNGAIGFAAGAFLLLLAPTSSFVPVAEQPIAENRMYLPLAVLVVSGVLALHRVAPRRSWVLVPLALALTVLTIARIPVYRSGAAVWADTVARRPVNPRGHFNHGVILLEAGRPADAAGHFQEAIRRRPQYPEAHDSLGNALAAQDRLAEADLHYAEAVRQRPAYARAWYNHGLLRMRQGDLDGAMARLEQALRIEPGFAEAHNSLGNVHFQRGEPALAIPYYERARRLDPMLADAHYNCGSACLEVGRVDEAIRCLADAARLKPADPEIRNHYGAALFRGGRVGEAIAQFEEALRLDPRNTDARSNLELARPQR